MTKMTGEIKEYNCQKISEYLDIINEVKRNWDKNHPSPESPYLFFRGQRNCWPLIPSILREYGRERKYEYSEFKIFNGYKRNITSLEEKYVTKNNLEILMNMQHYNIPTRLLDWTENCLTALYFAIINAESEDTPIVWVLHSGKLNSLTVENRNAPFIVDSPHSRNRADLIGYIDGEKLNQDYFEHYEEYINYKNYLEKPICYTPKITNKRMASQQSVFTIHGVLKNPIEKYFSDKAGLSCVKIEKNNIDTLKREIFNIGIRSGNLFPDIEGLSTELKQDRYRVYKNS